MDSQTANSIFFFSVLSTMLWSRAVMYPKQATFAQMYHDWDTFDFSQGHVTKNEPMAAPV